MATEFGAARDGRAAMPAAGWAGTSSAVVVRSATALACNIQAGRQRADWGRSRQASSVGDGLCPAVEILDEPASAALWARTRRRAGQPAA